VLCQRQKHDHRARYGEKDNHQRRVLFICLLITDTGTASQQAPRFLEFAFDDPRATGAHATAQPMAKATMILTFPWINQNF
jgi:hypothetical protein